MAKFSKKNLIKIKNSLLSPSQRRLILQIVSRWHAKTDNLISIISDKYAEPSTLSIEQGRHWNRLIIRSVIIASVTGLTWACLAQIDESVQGTGKIEPIGNTIDIKAPMGGVIKKILVTDNQIVIKDQILVELDTTAAEARLAALEQVLEITNADLSLSKSQLGLKTDLSKLSSNQQLKLKGLTDEYNSRIDSSRYTLEQSKHLEDSLKSNIASKREALEIREDILKRIKPLADIGAISKSQYLKELQEVVLLKGELEGLNQDLLSAQKRVLESRSRLQNTVALTMIDFSTKVEEGEKQLSQLQNQISEAKLTLKYQSLKAPVNGIVFDLQPSSPGYVVSTDKPVLKIVPTESLIAKIYISNQDIGFIKKEQDVKIRVDAYPYNEFGEVAGKIISIGSDSLEPDENFNYYRFPVTVSLKTPYIEFKSKRLPLITGMSLKANIVTRRKPVIAIFTENILPFWDSLEML